MRSNGFSLKKWGRLLGSALNLQKMIYSALTGDAQLSAVVVGVFDYVPEADNMPYIQIGDDTLKDWNTMDFNGKQAACTIHCWSRLEGRSECKTIQGHVQRILSTGQLSLLNAVLVLFQLEFETTITDPDGVTQHGVQRFRAFIQEGS